MKKLIYFIAAAMMVVLTGCGSKRSQAYYDQKSLVLSANYDGSYVIRTTVRSRNSALAFSDAQRKAVEEVIFDGVKSATNGVADLKPLCFDMNAREKHEDYFQAFFSEEGAWKQFVSLRDKRSGSTEYTRTTAQMVQTVTVTVQRADLKRRLQADGIIPMEGRY